MTTEEIRKLTDLELICRLVSPMRSDVAIRYKYSNEWMERHGELLPSPEKIRDCVEDFFNKKKSAFERMIPLGIFEESPPVKTESPICIPEQAKEGDSHWPAQKIADIILNSGWDRKSDGLKMEPERVRGILQDIIDNKYELYHLTENKRNLLRAVIDHYNRWVDWQNRRR